MTVRWIEQFIYQGRDPQSGTPASWCVTLGAKAADGFGGEQVTTRGPMVPEEAEALGFPLSAVMEGINAQALVAADQNRAALAQAVEDHTAALAQADDVRAVACRRAEQADDLVATLRDRLSSAQAQVRELLRRLDGGPAEPEDEPVI